MSKTAWIIVIVAVIAIIVVIFLVKRNAAKKSAEMDRMAMYQQPPQSGPTKGAGFMNFLGLALPIVLDNLNNPKTAPASNMAGAPTSNIAAIA